MQDIQPASTLASLARALATSTRRPGPVSALTPVSLALPHVVLDAQHIARYAEVCGFAPASTVPLTYPQMLTFPLVMHYMTSGACPWPAMGTVHLANTITQHAPLSAGDAVRVELHTGELLAHEKGQVFTLHLRVLRAVQDGDGSPRRFAPRDDGGVSGEVHADTAMSGESRKAPVIASEAQAEPVIASDARAEPVIASEARQSHQDRDGSPRRFAPRDDGGVSGQAHADTAMSGESRKAPVVASEARAEPVIASEARQSHGSLDCVWQATQTLLRVGVRSPVGAPFATHALADVGADDLLLTHLDAFNAPADIGRRYAPVSGDYNPIHLWPFTARLLGFKRAIAHGLWTQARALALLQPDGVMTQATLQTLFKRPLLLPAQASVWQAEAAPGQRLFEVRDAAGQVPHLRARLTLQAS